MTSAPAPKNVSFAHTTSTSLVIRDQPPRFGKEQPGTDSPAAQAHASPHAPSAHHETHDWDFQSAESPANKEGEIDGHAHEPGETVGSVDDYEVPDPVVEEEEIGATIWTISTRVNRAEEEFTRSPECAFINQLYEEDDIGAAQLHLAILVREYQEMVDEQAREQRREMAEMKEQEMEASRSCLISEWY